MQTTRAELTGLIVGYIVEQSIKNNVDVDLNTVSSEIDNFLADYADGYGLMEFDGEIFEHIINFMNKKILLSYKIDTKSLLNNVNVFYSNLELNF